MKSVAGSILSLCLLLCGCALSWETAGIVLKNGKAEVSGKAIDKPSDWKAFSSALKGRAKELHNICTIEFDAAAPWSSLQAALMGASAAGFTVVRIHWPLNSDSDLAIDLPGGDGENGEIVDLPVLDGEGDAVFTENDGKKLALNPELIKGLLSQLPKATVAIHPAPKIAARKVMSALALLAENRAVSVAYLPLREISEHLSNEKRKLKDAEERAAAIRRMVHGAAN